MKLFTDNKVDSASVSEAGATANYPATNVQDSRLSRIYRGGESIEFDISGSGALKNISQAYTNEVTDPTDLTTVNWTTSGVTSTLSTESIGGYSFYEVESSGGAFAHLDSAPYNAAITYVEYRATARKLTADTSILVFYNNTQVQIAGDITITFSTKTLTEGLGTLKDYTWIDDDTVDIIAVTDPTKMAVSDSCEIRLYANHSAADTNGTLWTKPLIVDSPFRYPFEVGAKAADSINETYSMPCRFSFDIILKPSFDYDTATFHRVFTWYVSATAELRLSYNATVDRYNLIWDDGTQRLMFSQQFDTGLSYEKLNQRLRFIGSLDLMSGGQTDSRFIVIPLEEGSKFENATWDGAPDVKTTAFPTLSIGHELSGSQADSEYEYLRLYEGLLVGSVTTSADADTLLEPKKILLDKTYQEKFTATDILIANSTINNGDFIYLRGNNQDSYSTGSPVDETITWTKEVTTHSFTKSTNQYWRLIVKSSNVVDIGRIYLGEAYTTPDISPSITEDRQSASSKSISTSGQSYLDARYFNSFITAIWPAVTHDEKEEIFDILEDIDIGKPFFVTFDETEIDLETRYVTLSSTGFKATLLIDPTYYTISVSMVEEV